MFLTNQQYLRRLKILRKHVCTLDTISGYDSSIIGAKETVVNVGMCNKEHKLIPKDMRIIKGRSSSGIKYTDVFQMCPLDTRQPGDSWGCFYHCRLFKKHGFDASDVTLDEVKNLYDRMIIHAENLCI